MAKETCSSSFSSIQTWCYDVFVSFCGKDTRYGFTDHLFAALDQNKIRAFRDDKKLERGKDIWTELEKAIETSRIAVIVFSRIWPPHWIEQGNVDRLPPSLENPTTEKHGNGKPTERDALITTETHEGKIRSTTTGKKPMKGGDETHDMGLGSSLHGSLPLVWFELTYQMV
jgi:hypothetical protein